MEVTCCGIRPLRVRLDAARFLTARGLERRQAGVRGLVPVVQVAGGRQVDDVVVGGRGRRRGVVDADVPCTPGAGDALVGGVHGVVDRDVVLDCVVRRGALDIDAGRAVVERRVAHENAAGHVEVVNAVVTVVVGDVAVSDAIVTAGIELDPAVLVVVGDVVVDGRRGALHVNTLGVALELLSVAEHEVVAHLDTCAPGVQPNPGPCVVTDGVVLDQRVGGSGEVDALRGLTRNGQPCVRDLVSVHRYLRRRAEEDAGARRPDDVEARDDDPALA